MPINKTHIISLCLLFCLHISCSKEINREEKSFYFLMGVVINDQLPVFKLFQMNLSGSVVVPNSDFDLELRTSLGDFEKLSNGQFSNIIGKSGVTYFVKWKRKSETKWHEFEKTLPEYDAELIANSIYETSNSFNINTNAKGFGYYLGPDLDLTNNNAWDGLYHSLTRGVGGYLLDLISDNNSVQIWPPKIKSIEGSGRVRFITKIECHKPFTWNTNQYEKYVLYQTYKKDFDNNFTLQTNHVKSDEPLYIGNPTVFDYKSDINYGNLFTYNIYRDVKLESIIKVDGVLHFKVLKNNQPFDSSMYEITHVRSQNQSKNIVAYYYNTNSRSSGILGFQDYFDYYLSLYPCKTGERHVLDFGITYRDKSTGVSQFYNYDNQYEYTGQSDTIIINLP